VADKRGTHPNSRKNLKQGNPDTQFNSRNAAEMAQKSHEAHREYKTLREIAKESFDEDRKLGWLAALADKADAGDAKAFEILRDTMGEKPSDSVEISGTSPFSVNIRVVD